MPPYHLAKSTPMSHFSATAHYTVLLVDDDETIRHSIQRYLQEFHEAPYTLTLLCSDSPEHAREQLAQNTIDLVISDIKLPGEDGFSLLQFVRSHYPKTKTALITAYRVEDYIRKCKDTGIYNIIVKSVPFNFDELSSVLNNLLIPDAAFGLDHYLKPSSQDSLQHFTIKNSDDIMVVFDALKAHFQGLPIRNINNLSTALIEALTNAVYHVARLPDGSVKYQKGEPIDQLAPQEVVTVQVAHDDEKVGIAILDQGGNIAAEEIVYWLYRNFTGAGILDTHGRGMFLIHTLVDRLIINIEPQRRTEFIFLDYFTTDFSNNKPLYINEHTAV